MLLIDLDGREGDGHKQGEGKQGRSIRGFLSFSNASTFQHWYWICSYSQKGNPSRFRSFSCIVRRLAGMHPLNWLSARYSFSQ